MPHKLRNSHRLKFKKVRYQNTNWLEYNQAPIKRSLVTLWLSPDVIKAWLAKKNKTSLFKPIYIFNTF